MEFLALTLLASIDHREGTLSYLCLSHFRLYVMTYDCLGFPFFFLSSQDMMWDFYFIYIAEIKYSSTEFWLIVGSLPLCFGIWAGSRAGLSVDGTQNTWECYMGSYMEKSSTLEDVGWKPKRAKLESFGGIGLEENRYNSCIFMLISFVGIAVWKEVNQVLTEL